MVVSFIGGGNRNTRRKPEYQEKTIDNPDKLSTLDTQDTVQKNKHKTKNTTQQRKLKKDERKLQRTTQHGTHIIDQHKTTKPMRNTTPPKTGVKPGAREE